MKKINLKLVFSNLVVLFIIISSFSATIVYGENGGDFKSQDFEGRTTIISSDQYQKMGVPSNINTSSGIEFAELIQMIINISLGLGVLLAIVLLIVGGVEYVTVDTFAGKSEGKERIQNALLGMTFLFISFLILKIINPALIDKGAINIAKVNLESTVQCGQASDNFAENAVDEYIENLNATGDYDWSLEGSDYWALSDGKCVAVLANNKGDGCRSQANRINQESAHSQGQTNQIDVYARCIACPKAEGTPGSDCKIVVEDGTDEGEKSDIPLDPEKDQVFLIFCRAFQTLTINTVVGSSSLWESKCVNGTRHEINMGQNLVNNYPLDEAINNEKEAVKIDETYVKCSTRYSKKCYDVEKNTYKSVFTTCDTERKRLETAGHSMLGSSMCIPSGDVDSNGNVTNGKLCIYYDSCNTKPSSKCPKSKIPSDLSDTEKTECQTFIDKMRSSS